MPYCIKQDCSEGASFKIYPYMQIHSYHKKQFDASQEKLQLTNLWINSQQHMCLINRH